MSFASLLSRNLQFNTAIAHFGSIKSIKDSLPKFPLFSDTEQIMCNSNNATNWKRDKRPADKPEPKSVNTNEPPTAEPRLTRHIRLTAVVLISTYSTITTNRIRRHTTPPTSPPGAGTPSDPGSSSVATRPTPTIRYFKSHATTYS